MPKYFRTFVEVKFVWGNCVCMCSLRMLTILTHTILTTTNVLKYLCMKPLPVVLDDTHVG